MAVFVSRTLGNDALSLDKNVIIDTETSTAGITGRIVSTAFTLRSKDTSTLQSGVVTGANRAHVRAVGITVRVKTALDSKTSTVHFNVAFGTNTLGSL